MAWWAPIIGPVANLFTKGLDIVDDLVEDKDLANQIKGRLEERMMMIAHTEMVTELESKTKIILAEAKGGWLQRNWRPLLMCICMLIIFNNYVFFPYASFWTDKAVILELPQGLWALLNVGTAGYIAGRSVEKIMKKE